MILAIYLLIVNVIAFATYGIDKRKARKGRFRIRESVLLTLSAIGGSIGALSGMYFFHHKTRKLKFKIIVPLTLIIHIIVLVYMSMH